MQRFFRLNNNNRSTCAAVTWCLFICSLATVVTMMGCRSRSVSNALPASGNVGNEGDLQDQAQLEYVGFVSHRVSVTTASSGGIIFVFKSDGQEEIELLAIEAQMIEFLDAVLKEGRRIRVGVQWDPSYNPKKFPPARPDLIVLKAEAI